MTPTFEHIFSWSPSEIPGRGDRWLVRRHRGPHGADRYLEVEGDAPWAGLVLLPLLSGCAFGPRLLEKSHGRYQESVKRVEDEELLRNLVRLR